MFLPPPLPSPLSLTTGRHHFHSTAYTQSITTFLDDTYKLSIFTHTHTHARVNNKNKQQPQPQKQSKGNKITHVALFSLIVINLTIFAKMNLFKKKTLDELFTGEEQMNSQHESPFQFFFSFLHDSLTPFFFQLSRPRHAPERNHTTSTQTATQNADKYKWDPTSLALNVFPCYTAHQLSFYPHVAIRINKQSPGVLSARQSKH